ncbi:histidine kinase [Micromonospora sp. LAH09]|uniref:sensor histidine kinase n=1 Tax=Micromonospora cabrerizensis TaxID=2911213 RepID=UPI001EE91DB6|nr:histidine kinase [Micromonospora cabrerizensis]MCG5471773.1 histidine kinase [Micromonospora cabrerizensis]
MRDHTGTDPGSPRLTKWLDQRLTRVGVTGVFPRDCLLAAALTVLTFVLLTVLFWFVAPEDGVSFDPAQAWLLVAVCCAQAMLLCLRRVRPLLCLGLIAGLQLPIIGVSLPEATIRGIAPFVVAYTVGSLLPLRRALLAVGAAVLVETVGVALLVTPDLLTAVAYVSASALTYLSAALVGSYVATYRRYVDLVRVRADEAIREQRTKVEAAIGAERSRMARELHDVAAHHLSGMVVQASAVERLIDRDPAAAKAGVAWIRSQGKETLDNLRLVVGVLRGRPGHEDADGPAPVPGLEMLDDLVRTAGTLAGPVELLREGPEREVSPIADVALYRIAQESLSNVRQHAPGAPARVVLRFLPRSVSLEVVNEPAAPRPAPAARTGGVGLAGMRERAQLIGASFTAGPTATGGWSVTATLPTNGPVAPHPREEAPA